MSVASKVQGALVFAGAAVLSALVVAGDSLREGLEIELVKVIVAVEVLAVGILAGLALWFKGEIPSRK